MGDWNELILSGSTSKDYRAKGEKQRVYDVRGYTPAQLYADPTSITNASGVPLPALNTNEGGLLLDRYDVATLPVGFRATALYSNDRRFQFVERKPRTSLNVGDQPLFDGGDVSVPTPFPYAERSITQYVVAAGSGTGPPETLTVESWTVKIQQTTTKMRQHNLRVVIDAGTIGDALSTIDAHARELHKIGGRWYRFDFGGYKPSTNNTYELAYSWQYDPGQPHIGPLPDLDPGGDVLVTPYSLFSSIPGVATPTGGWARPPYELVTCNIDVEVSSGTQIPSFRSRLYYNPVENGHLALPGIT